MAILEPTKEHAVVKWLVNQTVQGLSRGRYEDQIEKWLSPADPSTNYNEALKKRHIGTGQWLLQDARYSRWKEAPSRSFLWLNGIPGCGKTILSSTVIENLENDAATNTILYFYFTFTDTAKQTLEYALRALTSQLYHSKPDIQKYLDACFASHDNGRKQPSVDTLCRILDEMIRQIGEVWIVLDALDECPSKDRRREALLEWVYNAYTRHQNIHLLATSRPEDDIYSAITRWATTTDNIIPLQKESVQTDISSYIQWEVRSRKGLQRWEGYQKVQQEIESTLTEKAHGM